MVKRQRKPQKSVIEIFKIYLLEHARVLFASLGRIMKTPFTSLMTVLVLSVTLTLAGGFYLMVKNIQQLSGSLETSNQISVFLKTKVQEREAKTLAATIKGLPEVVSVKLIGKRQAMEEFKAYSGFGDALEALDNNPLPIVLQVLPVAKSMDAAAIKRLMDKLERYPAVDFAQLDMLWVKRLQSISALLQRTVMVLNSLLAVAIIFIMGNTIRLELQNRREEVLIAKLVGATHAFVQRPFIYTGFWLGLFAGVLAWILITLVVFVLSEPVENIASLYQGQFELLFLSLTETLGLLALSALLGVLGAWAVLFYQLRQIRPA
ncbi:permease-like cell division protein FtsX [methane-oxidizing endosymbiont of Gigantopelta aegis]|uniref:permease-like cell division protein FtsX n=1 Tax=methane-oxidizing endosymbiont of Gigantopelta aegis TaxID=2794938 RepID=UPI0018DE8BC0|nr:permease-like cell division protein FtsX [methane-oxidizing endosymbiont of Gigantopelta aegis]